MMLVHFGRKSPRKIQATEPKPAHYAILTTKIKGRYAPNAKYLIRLAKQTGSKPIVIYPESFKKGAKGWVLTIAGKIYSLTHLPFFSVLPVIGAKQQTSFTLSILQKLQGANIPVLNSAEAIKKSDDKLKCYQFLKEHGFANLPLTFDLSKEPSQKELDQLPEDVVVKQAQGSSGGDGVWFVKKSELSNHIAPNRLVQEQIALETEINPATGEKRVVDYRYFVINGKTRMVAKNISAPGELATNIKKGGGRETAEINMEMAAIAEEAVNRIGLKWAGVDIGRSVNGEIYVLEVNPTPSMLYDAFPAFHHARIHLYREILNTVKSLAKGRQQKAKVNPKAIA